MDHPTKPAFWSATDGSVLVEAAFVIPLLLVFVFGVEEYGRLFLSQSALQRATYAAARCAAVYDSDPTLAAGTTTTCSDASSTQAYAKNQLWGILNPASVIVTVTIPATPSCAGLVTTPASAVTVNANYAFNFVVNLPALLNRGSSTSQPLAASASYPTQSCS